MQRADYVIVVYNRLLVLNSRDTGAANFHYASNWSKNFSFMYLGLGMSIFFKSARVPSKFLTTSFS